MSPRVRVALVGLGKIARAQHVPAIRADPHYELVATVSPDGAAMDLPAFPDLDALLCAGLELDALSLCTPPGVRVDLARRALGAGLHVMLEKPPALSTAQAAPLPDAARQAGRSLFTAWHSRETDLVDAAAAWLKGRAIASVDVVWREDVRVWHPGQDWLLEAGGFGVFDPAINAFSILTAILPRALEVDGAELSVPVNRGAPAEAFVSMRCGDAPVRCDLSILESGPQRWEIAIRTDEGDLRLTHGGHHLRIEGRPAATAPDREYPRLYRRFAALIASGQSAFDLAPLTLVEQVLVVGRVRSVPAFEFA